MGQIRYESVPQGTGVTMTLEYGPNNARRAELRFLVEVPNTHHEDRDAAIEREVALIRAALQTG